MPYALLSVYDKNHLLPLAECLHQLGWKLLASGSTAQYLRSQQLPVTDVADYTKSPEMLGGRVKTLHPAIHAGILAKPNEHDYHQLTERGWDNIDLVAVNLYPFAETIAQKGVQLDDAIEQIDIGGVALLRGAAKNFQRVTVLADPNDYAMVIAELHAGGVSPGTRRALSVKAFQMTSHYDRSIHEYLADTPCRQLTLYPQSHLRYGENPHQTSTLYSFAPHTGPLGGRLLQGKALSYNNILDLDAAWRTVLSFQATTVCIVKHLSPCGVASQTTPAQAFLAALASDPISAFGGVIACNKPVDAEMVQAFGELFVECIAAPAFSDEALQLLSKRSNCRVLAIADTSAKPRAEWRSVNAGLLCQDIDLGDPDVAEWQVVSERQPTAQEIRDLTFAWLACQHVRSNAIVFAKNEATVGIGGGQPNRIDCVHIANTRAGAQTRGAVMASDAFFPFDDCVQLAAKLGISAIIQPGGSKRDQDSITAANQAGLVMIMTGVRHFRH